MEAIFQDVLIKRQSFATNLVKYLRLWFHDESVYNGKSFAEGGEGVLRYGAFVIDKISCCFITELMFATSKYFNLTLEYVDMKSKIETDNENSTIVENINSAFSQNVSFKNLKLNQ